jgi:hypothetical protein
MVIKNKIFKRINENSNVQRCLNLDAFAVPEIRNIHIDNVVVMII